ncbi:hypothetical protein M408DRAFT_326334 [Serendipita vermifera MAFF 305830]|uniref:BZIP domain-containing protein n=1 Tax=Serendipita vermifera MAFF 305830 TaxID=933852 RepID=A0A0C3BQI6_SERVB|nr:hypothetical protein M408DRAFT_326334 [Serendipita vermifera MAFF 305830]
MPTQPVQDRQLTQEQVSDSGDDGFDDEQGTEPKGKKRGNNSQAARRDQNRIAQREFRLRKQQRIRDLELRVELLSATKDEAFLSLDGMMQDLVRENATLRQLVRDLSSFIGEGIGGFLPKLGWDIKSFDEFRNRTETDAMNESYSHRKKHPNTPAPGIVPVLAGQKRGVEEVAASSNGASGARKRSKPNADEPVPSTSSGASYGTGTTSHYPNPSTSTQSSSSIYGRDTVLPPLSGVPLQAGGTGYANSNARAGPPPINTNLNTGNSGAHRSGGVYTSSASASGPNTTHQFPTRPVALSESSTPSLVNSISYNDEAQVSKREEAGKLIHYHITNYKRNTSYTLPFSLRPTHVQRTVNHEFIIDGILFPDIRDKMILFKGSFDLADAVHTLYSTSIIHTDDLLTHANWEVAEEWFAKYGYLATRAVLDATNKWRRERGETEIPASMIENDTAGFEP